MGIIFLQEIERLKERVVRLSLEVEARLDRALQAVAGRDAAMALAVMNGDEEIDTREVAIEEECLKLLALHQPVASDLRLLIAVLKINNDLERIGDLAVNIADRAVRLARLPPASVELHIPRMGTEVRGMLRQAFQAFLSHDPSLAARVVAHDDVVDEMNRVMIAQVVERLRRGDEAADTLLLLLGVSRELERTGDHATNIAEDLIYLFDGRIVRHRKTSPAQSAAK
jgi:phosphate transport system protein